MASSSVSAVSNEAIDLRRVLAIVATVVTSS